MINCRAEEIERTQRERTHGVLPVIKKNNYWFMYNIMPQAGSLIIEEQTFLNKLDFLY